MLRRFCIERAFKRQSFSEGWQPTPVLLPGKSHGLEGPGGLPSMGSHRVGQD